MGVLITYYGERELLRECLDSVLSGASLPDEILVYDDASSVPANRFVPTGAPVRVIRGRENRGPAFGRNLLLRESACDYVHFHDADDLFHPDWARDVRAVIAARAPDIVLTEITSVRDGEIQSERVLDLASLPAAGDLVRFALRGSLLVPSTTFRRELGLRLGGFRTREALSQSEDFDFHVRLAAAAASWEAIQRSLIIQRLRAGSHSANQVDVWSSAVRAVEFLGRELPPAYHDELADTAARIGSRLFEYSAPREADLAFRLAMRLGNPAYRHRSAMYRVVARTFGPRTAERLGRLLHSLRRSVRLRSWPLRRAVGGIAPSRAPRASSTGVEPK